MRGDPELRVGGRINDQPRQRNKQIGMDGRFRLIQRHERWRTRRKQSRQEAKVLQGAVRQFRRFERALKPGEKHMDGESRNGNLDGRSGERPSQRLVKPIASSDFKNRLNGGGQISSIMRQDRRANADLGVAER